MRLPWWLSGEESACRCRRLEFDPWVRKIPWRREWQPTPVFLPGEFSGQRGVAGYSPWACKELDMTKQQLTHNICNILTERICELRTLYSIFNMKSIKIKLIKSSHKSSGNAAP